MVYVIQAPHLLVHGVHTAQGAGGNSGAVVGVSATDEVLFVGFAQQVVIAVYQADVSVVGFRAGVGEEDVVEALGRDLDQRPGQLDSGLVGTAEKVVVEGQLLQLPVNGLDDLVLAVAKVAAPEAGHAVEQLVAVGIVDINVLCAVHDAAAAGRVVAQISKRMEVV